MLSQFWPKITNPRQFDFRCFDIGEQLHMQHQFFADELYLSKLKSVKIRCSNWKMPKDLFIGHVPDNVIFDIDKC